MKLEFFDRFSKSAQISHFIKIHPMRAEFFHTDEWTDKQSEAYTHVLQFCKHA
jgi:hypothetical protein